MYGTEYVPHIARTKGVTEKVQQKNYAKKTEKRANIIIAGKHRNPYFCNIFKIGRQTNLKKKGMDWHE